MFSFKSKAVCPTGYWLIVSGNLGPVCKPNPCESKMSLMTRSRSPEIYFRGECVKLRSPSNLCDNKDEIVMFAKGSLEPTCEQSKVRRQRIYKRQISKVNALKCQAGTIWSRITHKCRPVLQAKVIRDEWTGTGDVIEEVSQYRNYCELNQNEKYYIIIVNWF